MITRPRLFDNIVESDVLWEASLLLPCSLTWKKHRFTFSSLIFTVQFPWGFSSQNSTVVKGHLLRPSAESSTGLLANRREVVPWGDTSSTTMSPRRRCFTDNTSWTCSKVLMSCLSLLRYLKWEKKRVNLGKRLKKTSKKYPSYLISSSFQVRRRGWRRGGGGCVLNRDCVVSICSLSFGLLSCFRVQISQKNARLAIRQRTLK